MKRMPKSNNNYHDFYKLKDFIGKDDKFILESNVNKGIAVDYETLKDNFDLFKYILSIRKYNLVSCYDYESALFLEENYDKPIVIKLVDDYKNKDRSYININDFKKHKLTIPFSYCMWNPITSDEYNVDFVRSLFGDQMISLNGTKMITKEFILKVKKIVEDLYSDNLSDIEKIIIISNYLQSKIQYVDEIQSVADKVYEIDTNEKLLPTGFAQTAINENYGSCGAISGATELLLNNPIFNVNVRTIYGSGHFWNLVIFKDKNYFIDNTWAITRNPSRVDGALKAKDFSDTYLLFGNNTAIKLSNHKSNCYIPYELSEEDFNKTALKEIENKISKEINLGNYPDELRFKSKTL